ncbi:MAG: DUF4129 domain-containing protein [Nitriliruptoraceae bacterium]
MRWDPRTGTGLAIASAVLGLAVLGAAVGRSWRIATRDIRHEVWDVPLARLFERLRRAGFRTEPASTDPPDWTWVSVAGRLLVVAAVAVLVWRLVQWLRRRATPRRPREITEPSEEAVTTTVFREPEVPVLRRGVEAAQRHLAAAAGPTDAVVSAWLALEEAAATSGVRRRPAQTPTEFTVGVLERTRADADATTELLALYHRARFSRAAVGPADVASASDCFTRIAASWTSTTEHHGTPS